MSPAFAPRSAFWPAVRLLREDPLEIHIGDAIITAEAAEVANWIGATGPVEIVLTGNVRLKTILDPHQLR
jgi:hypothetical protein